MNSICDKESLYPIFISSMTRAKNARYNDFKPNLLLHDICSSNGSYKKLLIFLFIEGGLRDTRSEFEENIEYFKNLVNREFEKFKDPTDSWSKTPIIQCV